VCLRLVIVVVVASWALKWDLCFSNSYHLKTQYGIVKLVEIVYAYEMLESGVT